MVVIAVVLVGAEILALTFVGAKLWAGIYQTPPDPNSLAIDVQAEQIANGVAVLRAVQTMKRCVSGIRLRGGSFIDACFQE